MVIIGIDPGSQKTGYGLIEVTGNRQVYLASGHINLVDYSPWERLREIYNGIQRLLTHYQPEEAAIEQVFMHENPNSAIKLGQARGAAIVALPITIQEYAAREVKKAIVGHGGATKAQVAFMVRRLLNLHQPLQADAADALALALCHAQLRQYRELLSTTKRKRGQYDRTTQRHYFRKATSRTLA